MDLPEPVPQQGEVLLAVSAVAVTFADTLMRAGTFPAPLDLPAVLGRQVVGAVVKHGPGVSAPPMGARVVGAAPGGGYAELVTVPAATAVQMPEGLGEGPALGVAGAGLTALGVVEAARIVHGDVVVVTAAAGGVGSLAVQLAVGRGARVVGLASTAAKRELVTGLGADTALDSTGDWGASAQVLAGQRGINAVLDSVGGAVLDAGLRLLAPGGRHVLYGFAGGHLGALAPAQLGALLERNLTLTGYALDTSDPADVQERTADLLALAASGRLQVPLHDGYHLEDAARAHQAITSRQTSGTVVLSVP